jgi:O-antigen/teichoic acid export membrane protein
MVYLYGVVAIGVFRAFERMAYELVVLVLQGCVLLVLVLLAIYLEASVLVLLGVVLVAYAVMVIAGWLLVRSRFTRPDFHVNPQSWRSLFREAVPVGISAFLFVSYSRIGTVALELSKTSADVGLFNAAFSLTRNLGVVPIAFSGAILPTFSQLAVLGVREVSLAYTRALKYMLMLALPIAVAGTQISERLVRLIFGPDFAGAGVALQIIIWSVLFWFLSLVTRTALLATNRQVLWTYTLAAGVLVNLALNVALVPRLGVLGASVALLVADVVIFGLASYAISRHLALPTASLLAASLKVAASAVLMGIVVYLLSDVNLILLMFLGAAVYGFSLLLLRALDSEELALIKGALRPWKQPRL